jgi:ABC-type branched-subunit amino acid transport system ATPase component
MSDQDMNEVRLLLLDEDIIGVDDFRREMKDLRGYITKIRSARKRNRLTPYYVKKLKKEYDLD